MNNSSKRSLRGPTLLDTEVQLHGANDNGSERDERSVTVAEAATQLGCDASTVRVLLRKGVLVGHRVGKSDTPKGVRVKMWSIREYESRHPLQGARQHLSYPASPRPARSLRNKADAEASARLKALGA